LAQARSTQSLPCRHLPNGKCIGGSSRSHSPMLVAQAGRPASYPATHSQQPYHQSYGSASYGAAAAGYGQPSPHYNSNYALALQYPQTLPPHGQVSPHYSPQHHGVAIAHHPHGASHHGVHHHPHGASHHRVHDDFGPISPYPELKDLCGPLLLSAAQHEKDRMHHGHAHHRPPGHGQHPQQRHANYPVTVQSRYRQQVGLPDFPIGWIEDPHEHQHRQTYEQLLHSAWEHHHKLQEQRHGAGLGVDEQHGGDMQAMNAALAGPQGHVIQSHDSGSPNQLLEPIKHLMEAKRAEADRVRDVATQYQNARGPEDPGTQQAQEMALRAEAEAGGVLAVERALESAPQGQGLQAMATTVGHFEEENKRSQVAWSDALGKLGESHPKVIAERLAMLKADAAYQGAAAAQAAPAQRSFEAAENPQAIANRASDAADAYNAEAEELSKKAEQLRRKWGAKDPRVAQAQKEADEAAAKAKTCLQESAAAQGIADGKPLPKPEAKKKVKKKQRGIC